MDDVKMEKNELNESELVQVSGGISDSDLTSEEREMLGKALSLIDGWKMVCPYCVNDNKGHMQAQYPVKKNGKYAGYYIHHYGNYCGRFFYGFYDGSTSKLLVQGGGR